MKQNKISPRVSDTQTLGENVRRTLAMRICSLCSTGKNLTEFYTGATQCKSCQLANKKRYYQENKELIKAKRKTYYDSNKAAVRKSESKYRKARRQTDVSFKLMCNIRNHVGQFLKSGFKNRTITYLGCTLDELKSYLEKQFSPGMSWENYGVNGWHIDHKFPLSKVNLSDLEAIKKVLHYTNLQPLWAKDNIKKSNCIY
jgi:hypothetical protein